jgi:hypothetical protein
MNRGILTVVVEWEERVMRIRDVLPENHRIVAERRYPGSDYSEMLIEGPDMPPPRPDDDGPEPVFLRMQYDRPNEAGPIKRSMCWVHLPDKYWDLPDLPFERLT